MVKKNLIASFPVAIMDKFSSHLRTLKKKILVEIVMIEVKGVN